MVGLMKQCLYKPAGKANLSWEKLEEVLLDIEITLNNRPLNYMDELQRRNIQPRGRHSHVRGGSAEKNEICQEVQG